MRTWALLLTAVTAVSCQCGGTVTIVTDGGGGSGGSGGGGAVGGGAGGGTGGCATACGAGQYCSVTGQCVTTGNCGANADCLDGKICEPGTNTCVPGSTCGSTQVTGALVEPSLIIALDRSCSMTEKVGMKTKWQIAVGALTTLTTTLMGKAYFGLALFPDKTGTNCSQDAIPIPLGPNKEVPIQQLLNAALVMGDPLFPNGPCVTNIDTGVQQVAADPGLSDPARKGYVLLITDGAQSGCSAGGGNTGTQTAIDTLRTLKGVNTFVIGFGGQVDVAALNSFADKGGVPSGDPVTHFYKAEDQAGLDAALSAIGSRTLSCTYRLTMVPPDPARLFVFFDKTTQVLRDISHAGGWDYDMSRNEVSFFGQACDDLKNNRVTKLDIVYGCPVPGVN